MRRLSSATALFACLAIATGCSGGSVASAPRSTVSPNSTQTSDPTPSATTQAAPQEGGKIGQTVTEFLSNGTKFTHTSRLSGHEGSGEYELRIVEIYQPSGAVVHVFGQPEAKIAKLYASDLVSGIAVHVLSGVADVPGVIAQLGGPVGPMQSISLDINPAANLCTAFVACFFNRVESGGPSPDANANFHVMRKKFFFEMVRPAPAQAITAERSGYSQDQQMIDDFLTANKAGMLITADFTYGDATDAKHRQLTAELRTLK